MTFENEPEWMKAARQAPLRSTWESRQQFQRSPMPDGTSRAEVKEAE